MDFRTCFLTCLHFLPALRLFSLAPSPQQFFLNVSTRNLLAKTLSGSFELSSLRLTAARTNQLK